MISCILHHRIVVAVAMASLAAVIALLQSPPALQNDDLQIYFMLLNGGESAVGYSLFTNYALGWGIAHLSELFPALNVYLLYLFVLAFVACCSSNFYILEAYATAKDKGSCYSHFVWLIACLVMLLINIACMSNMQYTHVAIWAAISSVLLLSSLRKTGWLCIRTMVAACLLVGAFALRESSVVPALFIAVATLYDKIRNIRLVVICTTLVLLLASFWAWDRIVYKNSPEWQAADVSMGIRQKILDSEDNSGLDKSKQLAKQGINPALFKLFKSFIYVPSMDGVAQVEAALPIHREGRQGLWGSRMLADAGFLAAPLRDRLGKELTMYQQFTPWVPLFLALFLYLPGMQRRGLVAVVGMLIVVMCYVGVLLALQRVVGRVLDPVLYGASVWILSFPPAKSRLTESRWLCACSACVSVAFMLFFVRHWHVAGREAPVATYCAAHADKLYLTTCQQNLGLYPSGFAGYSYDWLHRSNILPVADGWNFYTPAYKAALKARGFQNLQEALLHPDTLIIVRKDDRCMTQSLGILADCEWNKKIEFSVVDTYGGFDFVKINSCQ